MTIRWTPAATADLEHIVLYIWEDNSEAAIETVASIFERIEKLTTFPHSGRNGREPNTRELVLVPLPYVVVYRVGDVAVEVLHIWHGAQQRV